MTAKSETSRTSETQRVDALDALRGVAVLGIFVINILGFGLPGIAFSNPMVAGGDGNLNYGLWTFTTVFVEGSMRGLFSLMFGASIMLFCSRAPYPDGPIGVADLYYRRTLWLIAFGLIHGYVLLMPGDILLIYGLAGLLLFPFRLLSGRAATLLAAVILVGLTLFELSLELPETALAEQVAAIEAGGGPQTESEVQAVSDWQDIYKGNWPEAGEIRQEIDARIGGIPELYASNAMYVVENSSASGLTWWVVDACMMMLLGIAFYRWDIVTGRRSGSFYLRMAAIGYAVGLSFRIWAVATRWEAAFSPVLWAWSVFDQVGRVAMTMGHIGLFFVIWRSLRDSLPMRALAAAGRMALTNYIGQTVVANLLFTGLGLGLFATFDRSHLYGIMVLIWLFQLAFSLWWLSHYRYGPLEWVWRSLTRWRRIPLR